jgi:hypothetical protein
VEEISGIESGIIVMTMATDKVYGKQEVKAKNPALRHFCMTFNIVGVTGCSSVWPSQQLVARSQLPAASSQLPAASSQKPTNSFLLTHIILLFKTKLYI